MPENGADQRLPQPTSDGSMTLHSARFGQCYHSRHGARTESDHVFLDAGYQRATEGRAKRPLRLLELGLGTGLNALLTLDRWRRSNAGFSLDYVALEPFPLAVNERAELALDGIAGALEADHLHAHPDAESHRVEWAEQGQFTRLKTTWQHFARNPDHWGSFDLIYYDAFAPDSQPELWEPERFQEAFKLLREEGTLVTYCAKGAVRRAMKSAGFRVERLPGPPGKREMLRATRPAWNDLDIQRFNVRVYFFLLDRPMVGGTLSAKTRILLSDECLAGRDCTKLPGGGLEFGEGPMDCARREAREELGQDIDLGPLVHVTGDFVRSAWRGEEQVLCHYYLATLPDPVDFRVADEPFDCDGQQRESFRWVPAQALNPEDFTFAVDRDALGSLRQRFT
ncbi:MAG: NUDIX domain-containing protein [Crocinitomicaceae bacterium TMED114]|nr:MAG: NUDIX domain-containing protein [Crocinitomicaceae bacterium TMED114]